MENIKYSGMIVSMRTKDGDVIERSHRIPLHIGNINLKDFNKRMETNTVLEYDNVNKSFKIESTENNQRIKYLSGEFLIELNRFLTLDRNVDFDQQFIKTEYVNGVATDFDNLKQEIRSVHRFKEGGLSYNEKEKYLNTINELIKLRKDSFPIAVLTESEIIQNCKEEINTLCENLSKELVRKKQ